MIRVRSLIEGRAVLCTLLVAAYLAGCAGAPGARGAFSHMEFTVRGGIAGFDLALSVAADGSARLVERGEPRGVMTLADSTMTLLHTRLTAATPAASETSHGKSGRIMDGWQRTLAVETGGRTWSVTEVSDPDDPLPPALGALFETLMGVTMRMVASTGERE